MRLFPLFLLFLALPAFGQNIDVLRIDSLPATGILLKTGWTCQTGDDPNWAKPGFDDSVWTPIDPTKEIADLPQIFDTQIRWLRLDFEVKTKLPNPLGIAITQAGASEIYLNGRLIHQFGHFDTAAAKVKAYDPLMRPIHFPADSVGQYTLAVRYALQPNIRYTNIFGLTKNRFFEATLTDLVPTLHAQGAFKVYYLGLEIFVMGIVFMLFVLHAAFYLYQRHDKTQLVLAVYLLGVTIIRVFKVIGQNQFSVEYRYFSLNIANFFLGFVVICLCNVIYRVAKVRLDKYYYAIVVFQIVYCFASGMTYGPQIQTLLLLIGNVFSFVVLIRLIRIGFRKRIKGFLTLGIAVMFAVIGLAAISIAVLFLNYGISPQGHNALNYGISPYFIDAVFTFGAVAIPIGLSLFIGIQSNETNQALSRQLLENDQLKNKAIEQEQEKQHLLAAQNETLEQQVKERTAALNHSLETLKSAQAQLIQSEKLASLGELTAGIAHEIQNPLNFVNNFSELSVDLTKEISEEIDKAAIDKAFVKELMDDLTSNQQKINHHGKRAAAIVTGMLQHTRSSTGKKEPTDLNALADEYLRLSYHGLRAKDPYFNTTMVTEFDPTIGSIEVAPQEMGRVLLNLFNNAFYAVQQRKANAVGEERASDLEGYEPTVCVSTQKMGNQIIVKVKDNGTGIPEAVKAKIFQPFFTTKPTGHGTGLGLSLSYDIVVKGHGGTLEVETNEMEGTTFCIGLPLT